MAGKFNASESGPGSSFTAVAASCASVTNSSIYDVVPPRSLVPTPTVITALLRWLGAPVFYYGIEWMPLKCYLGVL
jgi:hypothetical protein